MKSTNEVQEIIENYSTNYDNWWKISKYIKDIDNEITAFEENYEESMEVGEEVSFSASSYFLDNQNYVEIDNCIWKRKDGNNDFSTDSDDERKFAKVLKEISTKISKEKSGMFDEFSLFGKNFTQNSKISFEYYNLGIHKSYPDFVLKDRNGTIHIFEVKSVNKSGNSFIKEDEYNNKVNQIKKCYQFASKKKGQVFYLQILDGENWKIFKYKECE